MAIFNSYVKLPEGIVLWQEWTSSLHSMHESLAFEGAKKLVGCRSVWSVRLFLQTTRPVVVGCSAFSFFFKCNLPTVFYPNKNENTLQNIDTFDFARQGRRGRGA